MLARRRSSKINLKWQPAFWLAVSAATAVGLALSTYLPWYRASDSDRFSPRSRWLLPPLGGSPNAPGTAAWGRLILAAALGVAVIAAIAAAVTVRHKAKLARPTIAPHLLVAAATTIVLIAVILEVRADPPFGDGPTMVADWGAPVGTLAALVSAGAACWALISSRVPGKRDRTVRA